MDKIDGLIKKLYDSISFKVGDKPDTEQMESLFIEEATLINYNQKEPALMTPAEFSVRLHRLINEGGISAFTEEEIFEHTDKFGKIAHRLSTYKAVMTQNGKTTEHYGINSIQMILINDNWRINSIIWNDQTTDLIIPDKYLPA